MRPAHIYTGAHCTSHCDKLKISASHVAHGDNFFAPKLMKYGQMTDDAALAASLHSILSTKHGHYTQTAQNDHESYVLYFVFVVAVYQKYMYNPIRIGP